MLGIVRNRGFGVGRRWLHARGQGNVGQNVKRICGGAWGEVLACGCAPCSARARALDTLTVCVQRRLLPLRFPCARAGMGDEYDDDTPC